MRHTLTTLTFAMLAFAGSALAQGGDRFVDVVVSLDIEHRANPAATNKAMAAEAARGFGVRANRTYGTVFSGFAARVPEGRLNALKNDPLVESVTIDQPVWAMPRCNSPNTPPCEDDGGGGDDGGSGTDTVPWGISRIGADTNSNTGAGIDVYIIDSGIDGDHPDLNVVGGYAVETCKGGRCVSGWDDDDGHGTHVAGTVGALSNGSQVVGVAPGVNLWAVKVLDKRGSGSFSGIIEGIDWVASQVAASGQPAVANMSLGGSGSKTGTCTSSGFTGDDNLHRAICEAANVGVVFAVAAGNSGADAAGAVPAAYDDAVMSVSATDSSDDWASWSNYGTGSASYMSTNSAPVSIAAPGVSILSTWNDGSTNTISGTSMASPHVAGAMALYLNSNALSGDFSAFTNTRSGLLNTAESTDGFSNTSGNPHDEDFLDAGAL